jgi:hypothetical protein
VVTFLSITSHGLFAADIRALTGTNAGALERGQVLRDVQFKEVSPSLAPEQRELRALLTEAFDAVHPTILAETLRLLPKESAATVTPSQEDGEAAADAAAETERTWSETERLTLANKISAISTLSGIEYYSTGRKAMRVFYESAYVVGSPSDKKRLDDPRYARLPPRSEVYALMKDLTFGENLYLITYHFGPGALVFVQENVKTVFLGPIPVAGKNEMRSVAAIVDSGEYNLVYAASMVKAPPIPGFTTKISASFSSRLDALVEWLKRG